MSQEEQIKLLESQLDEISTMAAEQFFGMIKILTIIASTQESNYEGSHARFVASKSAEIARIMGLNDEEVFEIETAGLLHDIGKLALNPAINKKFPTELNQQEFELYQRHPGFAQKMLSYSPRFENIAKIIYQHHEHLDGSGFPNHLQGKEIEPGAAIIAVVDTYHNLFCKRTSRDKMLSQVTLTNTEAYINSTKTKFSNAVAHILKFTGKYYDTKAVEVFIDLIEDERKTIGASTVMKVQVHKLEPGWIIADDYFSNNGLLLSARGEVITPNMKRTLLRLAEHGEIPLKLLIMKR